MRRDLVALGGIDDEDALYRGGPTARPWRIRRSSR